MTKKHFEAAAAYVRRFWNGNPRSQGDAELLIRGFSDLFAQFNPRFDETRFRAACRGLDTATTVATRTVRA